MPANSGCRRPTDPSRGLGVSSPPRIGACDEDHDGYLDEAAHPRDRTAVPSTASRVGFPRRNAQPDSGTGPGGPHLRTGEDGGEANRQAARHGRAHGRRLQLPARRPRGRRRDPRGRRARCPGLCPAGIGGPSRPRARRRGVRTAGARRSPGHVAASGRLRAHSVGAALPCQAGSGRSLCKTGGAPADSQHHPRSPRTERGAGRRADTERSGGGCRPRSMGAVGERGARVRGTPELPCGEASRLHRLIRHRRRTSWPPPPAPCNCARRPSISSMVPPGSSS